MKPNKINSDACHDLVQKALVDVSGFARAIFSNPDKSQTHEWRKIVVRLVLLKKGLHWQVSRFDARKDLSKNYSASEIGAIINEILSLGFKNILIDAKTQQITLQKIGEGQFLQSQKSLEPDEAKLIQSHDKAKNSILDPNDPLPFLGMLGFTTQEGRLKADKREKFTQINEFLRILSETEVFPKAGGSFSVVDFGCGNAYLTFALYHYLVNELSIEAKITGVDVQAALIKSHVEKAELLKWPGLKFEAGTIQNYKRDQGPDAVVALHACDTATDDAIAQGIEWGASLIVVAPCCHHNLQAQIKSRAPSQAFGPVYRYGLMAERQADILTDAFRALILRMRGYKTDIIQFVDPSNTPKNLMIRAIKTETPAPANFFEEYEAMKSFWGVIPYLETKLPKLN